EARVVGERKSGRSPVARVLRGAGDAQFRRYVVAIREERRGQIARTAECVTQVANELGREVVTPGNVWIHVAPRAAIQEPAGVRGGIVAARVADPAVQPVLRVNGLIQARIDVVAILHGGD